MKKREELTEVDVTVELENTVIFVEAKYQAEVSTRTKYDRERDQIVRSLDVGLSYSESKNKAFYLILLTNEKAPPELLVRHKENKEEILKKLPHRRLSRDVSNCLAWTNWKRIAELLRGQKESFSAVEKHFVKDLLDYLESKTVQKERI